MKPVIPYRINTMLFFTNQFEGSPTHVQGKDNILDC